MTKPRGFAEPPMPAGKQSGIMTPPPPLNTYPTDTVQTVRDAAITQSQRALDLLREHGLPTP